MIKKLRRKFIAINMILAVVMLLVIFSLGLAFTARSLEQESLQAMQAVATMPPGGREQVRQPWFRIDATPAGVMVTGSDYYDLEDEAFLRAVLSEATGQSGVLERYDLRYSRITFPGEKRWCF